MVENILTAGPEQRAELADIQARLATLMANAQDDKSKQRIFNQIVVPLTESLPDIPPVKDKYPAPLSDSARCLFDANDKLREASAMALFVQSISLNGPSDGTITLQSEQVTGFYFVMKNTIDRIREAETLIDEARTQPEALPA
ncbi:MAG: hypothetical protein Q7S51_07275 [Gallionellaceae bacterium]|nr:hypothetical protein [Gallionellaceae bacterium]